MTARVLVVEDQQDINTLITLNLEMLGFQVSSTDNGSVGLQKAVDEHYDLIVLDVMLPGIDGFSVCRGIRDKGKITPILMLTAKKSEADLVMGLSTGADDYLTKPFSVLELQARAKALLRRMALSQQDNIEKDSNELTFDGLSIKKEKRHVQVRGETINLTAKEFDLLLYLAHSPGQVFSREQLLNAVWGYQHSGYEHTVNSHINRLRAKLERDSCKPDYIITVWGVGYKFGLE